MQAEGPYASAKGMRNFQRAQSTSRPSDAEASCENQAGSRVRPQCTSWESRLPYQMLLGPSDMQVSHILGSKLQVHSATDTLCQDRTRPRSACCALCCGEAQNSN